MRADRDEPRTTLTDRIRWARAVIGSRWPELDATETIQGLIEGVADNEGESSEGWPWLDTARELVGALTDEASPLVTEEVDRAWIRVRLRELIESGKPEPPRRETVRRAERRLARVHDYVTAPGGMAQDSPVQALRRIRRMVDEPEEEST